MMMNRSLPGGGMGQPGTGGIGFNPRGTLTPPNPGPMPMHGIMPTPIAGNPLMRAPGGTEGFMPGGNPGGPTGFNPVPTGHMMPGGMQGGPMEGRPRYMNPPQASPLNLARALQERPDNSLVGMNAAF